MTFSGVLSEPMCRCTSDSDCGWELLFFTRLRCFPRPLCQDRLAESAKVAGCGLHGDASHLPVGTKVLVSAREGRPERKRKTSAG